MSTVSFYLIVEMSSFGMRNQDKFWGSEIKYDAFDLNIIHIFPCLKLLSTSFFTISVISYLHIHR